MSRGGGGGTWETILVVAVGKNGSNSSICGSGGEGDEETFVVKSSMTVSMSWVIHFETADKYISNVDYLNVPLIGKPIKGIVTFIGK